MSGSIVFLAGSAVLVGMVHSLAPGHWLPVVLLMKSRKWSTPTAMGGALIAASGHIIVSILLGGITLFAGAHLISSHMEEFEKYSALFAAVFGLLFAAFAFFRHSDCHTHAHHGPEVSELKRNQTPYLFLFSLGLSPCVAAFPVFAAAAAFGHFAVLTTMMMFSLGVSIAFLGATYVVSKGTMKLDHPIFEHYGDVITGLSVAAMGMILFFVPELF